jgi:hypothetical protein
MWDMLRTYVCERSSRLRARRPTFSGCTLTGTRGWLKDLAQTGDRLWRKVAILHRFTEGSEQLFNALYAALVPLDLAFPIV